MEKLRKIKKGEEGLNQLRDYFANSSDNRAYGLNNIISECIARSEDGFDARYELYGYNENHDLAEGVISSFKSGETFIHKDRTTVTKADGSTSNKMAYTVIKPEKGRYNIMTIEVYKKEPSKLIINDKIGTNAETKEVIDLTNDFPRKYNNLFNKAFDAMGKIDDKEIQYIVDMKQSKENDANIEMNNETDADDESEL